MTKPTYRTGRLSHINTKGKAEMVDVSEKKETVRTASAFGEVFVSDEIFERIKENTVEKGDVLSIAKFAGIQGAKRTAELIPLCHNIEISKINVGLKLNPAAAGQKKSVEITSFAKTVSKTGVEMEALTAVSVAALTVYDMCKVIDKSIEISNIKLLMKTGGKSGEYHSNKELQESENITRDY